MLENGKRTSLLCAFVWFQYATIETAKQRKVQDDITALVIEVDLNTDV